MKADPEVPRALISQDSATAIALPDERAIDPRVESGIDSRCRHAMMR
jgi:hypothetical protein